MAFVCAAGVKNKAAVTHIHRTDLMCRQTEAGVPHLEVRCHQGLEHTTSTDVYLRGSFHIAAMLPAVGWDDKKSYFCWWESDGSEIPPELLHAVFPGLDKILMFVKDIQEKVGGGDDSAVAVLETLKHLRKVFLEDAVYRQAKYPTCPAYATHPIFNTPRLRVIFNTYAAAEKQRVASREVQYREKDANITYQLNDLNSKVEKLLQQQYPAAAEEVTPPNKRARFVANILPLPPLPESINTDLVTFYRMWQTTFREQYTAHLSAHKKCLWKQLYNDSKVASALSQRWHAYKGFFELVDSVGDNTFNLTQQQNEMLDVITAFGEQHKVSAVNLVKKVLNVALKPSTKADTPVFQQLAQELYTELIDAGFKVVQQLDKQDHSKKQQRQEEL